MIPYKNRFHSRNALRFIYRNGTTSRSSLLTLKTVRNQRRTIPRVAIVVSKKVLKSAVGRNRIRRRLYEIVRHDLGAIYSNADVVFIVTSAEVKSLDQGVLVDQVRNLLQTNNLYKKQP